MVPCLELLFLFFDFGWVDAVVIEDHFIVNDQSNAVVSSCVEGVFIRVRNFEGSGKYEAVLVLIIVEIELDQIIGNGAFPMRCELGEIGKFGPGAVIEGELEIGQCGSLAEDFENAFHAHGVAGKAADVGVGSRFFGSSEFNHLLFLRIQEIGFEPDPWIVGKEIAFHGLLGLLEHFHDELFHIGSRLTEHDVVWHVVWVLES